MNRLKLFLKKCRGKWDELETRRKKSICFVLCLLLGTGCLSLVQQEDKPVEEQAAAKPGSEEQRGPGKQIYSSKVPEGELRDPFQFMHGGAPSSDKAAGTRQPAELLAAERKQSAGEKELPAVNTAEVRKTPAPVQKVSNFRLTGVIIDGRGATALIVENNSKRRVQMGDYTDSGKVVRIGRNTLEIATGSGNRIYRLD